MLKSVGLWLGSWKGCLLLCLLPDTWFSHDFKVKNWLEVLEKGLAIVHLWLQRNLFLKGMSKVCITYIYPLILYHFTQLQLPSIELVELEKALFWFLQDDRAPMLYHEVRSHHLSEDSLGMSNLEIHWHYICNSLVRCVQKWVIKVDSGRKMPRKPFRIWGAGPWMRGRPTVCPETRAPSTVKSDMY